MDNQHRKIIGYRELPQVDIDLMNEVKAEGERLKALTEKVAAHLATQMADAQSIEWVDPRMHELERLRKAEPQHWLKIGTEELQTGVMFLVRAVAQPTTF